MSEQTKKSIPSTALTSEVFRAYFKEENLSPKAYSSMISKCWIQVLAALDHDPGEIIIADIQRLSELITRLDAMCENCQ